MSGGEIMDKYSEVKQLAKRINQRMVRAERLGVTYLKEYQDLQAMLGSSGIATKSGKRFKESIPKNLPEEQLKRVLGLLRRADTFKTFVGKEAKKRLQEAHRRFKVGFGEDIDESVVNDYLAFTQNDIFKTLNRYLTSDQIMEIVEKRQDNPIDYDRKMDEYMAERRGQQFNREEFLEFVFNLT